MEPSKPEDNKTPTEGYVWGDEDSSPEQLPIESAPSESGSPTGDQLPIEPRDPNGGADPDEELPIK
ncbi:hypothetical protein KDA00_05770 [Candidatus Saccharibacteria bacterium]|nr:hypothetical protein [Candidatus Saccharibacteria bacterium]